MDQKYPRIVTVEALANRRLFVTFDNGISKIYDCSPLLENGSFRLLQDEAFFRCAHADPHGYGAWSGMIELTLPSLRSGFTERLPDKPLQRTENAAELPR